MTYPDQPGYKISGTSQEVAQAMQGKAPILSAKVLQVLQCYELTTDECADVLNESVLSIRPRFSELQQQGRIEKTNERRRNASGHSASVWRIRHGQLAFTL
jgi:hypothetical protein